MKKSRLALSLFAAVSITTFGTMAKAATTVLDPGPGTDYLGVWCGGQAVNEIATGFDAAANPETLVKVSTTCHGSGRGSPNQYYLACWTVTFGDQGDILSKVWLATNHWAQGHPSVPCPVPADPAATFTVTDGAGNFPATLSTGSPTSTEYRAVLETSCAPIAFGESSAGTIGAPGETTCHSLRGAAGDAFQVETVQTSGSLLPIPTVFRPDGSILCGGESSVASCVLDGAGRQIVLVQDQAGTGTGSFELSLDCVSPSCTPFDYTLARSGDITVTVGASGSNTITASLSGGITESVSFAVSGLPSGAAASFDVGACSPDCAAELTITTTTDTPAGTYPIVVTGSPLGRATTFSLVVSEASGCGNVPAGGGAPWAPIQTMGTALLWVVDRLRRTGRRPRS